MNEEKITLITLRRGPQVQSEAIIHFVAHLERFYGLPANFLHHKWPGTNRPKKAYNDVNVSEIRKAVIYLLHDRAQVSNRVLARLIGIGNPTTIVKLRKRVFIHAKTKDAQFLKYLTEAEQVYNQLFLYAKKVA